MRLRIGIDVACWENARGYGRFTRELLRAMVELAPDDRFVCFLDDDARRGFDLESHNVELATVRLSSPPAWAAAAGRSRSIRDMLRLTRAVAREHLDVFFFPSVYTYFPLPPGLPALTTIHDTIPERYPELTHPRRRDRLFWRLKRIAALRQSRLILTVSEYSARGIAKVLAVAPESIRVASEASSSIYRPSRPDDVLAAAKRVGLKAEARWFVYVGGFNPHKRVDALVRAHGRIVRHSPADPPYLLLVGDASLDVFHKDLDGIQRAIHEEGTEKLVLWTGYVPDEELRHLLSGAVALVLPSRAEGFGLPAVEAAACGAAIVATTESPLPTLLAGGGCFVDPGDEAALFEAMRFLLDDEPERRRMGRVAREQAAHLTWNHAARVSMSALREIAK
jgi:glycosyltransferase involved in cell wall biosynthesis